MCATATGRSQSETCSERGQASRARVTDCPLARVAGGGETKKTAVAVALAITPGAAFAAVQAGSGGSLPAFAESKPPSPRADEAPALTRSDVPSRLVPQTVTLGVAEAAAFRARLSRIAQYRRSWSPDLTPAAGSPIKAHERTELGGGIWFVTTYRNADGLFCHCDNLGDQF